MLLEVALKCVLGLLLLAAGVTYGAGWWHLRIRGHQPPRWRAASYVGGLASIALAVFALDRGADERFVLHMAQHLTLVMVAAPLVLLGNPLPLLLWGVPRRVRRILAAPLRPGARLRAALATLTWAPVAAVVYVVTVCAWHVPLVYDAAVERALLHAVEHGMFFGTAILFWWPIIQPAPTLRPALHPGFQIFYLILATAQNTALGMVLTLPDRAFYPHYVATAALSGASAIDDQALGGGLMWGMGHMFLLPILVILYRLSRQTAHEPQGAAA